MRGGSGGGSGATLVVTGVAGSTVTATKGDKTYTRTLNSEGKATFKGLASGTWTITMTDGTQTVTRTVTITADYDLTIAYFSATISITYPAASTCVVTDSSGTQIASDTNGDSSAKTWTATVGATGTYTITATSATGSESTSESVSVTAEGQTQSVVLSYDYVIYSETEEAWKNGYSLINLTEGAGADNGANPDANPPYIGSADEYAIGARLSKLVDVTDYKTLKITGSLTGNSTQWETAVGLVPSSNPVGLEWWSDSPGTGDMVAYFTTHNFSKGTKTIDISKLSGEYGLKWNWYASDLPSQFTINDIRLVK